MPQTLSRSPGNSFGRLRHEGFVCSGRRHRVLDPVDTRRLASLTAAKIDPRVRVLVHKQRVGGAHVGVFRERRGRPRPRTPRLGRNGMCRRADRGADTGSSTRNSGPSATAEIPVSGFQPWESSSRSPCEHPVELDATIDRVGGAAGISVSPAKHCLTVSTPARSRAVSIDDNSLGPGAGAGRGVRQNGRRSHAGAASFPRRNRSVVRGRG